MGLQSDVSIRPKLSTFNVENSFSFSEGSCNERDFRSLSINYLIGSFEVVGVEEGVKALDCGWIKVDYCATPVGDKSKTFENMGHGKELTLVDTPQELLLNIRVSPTYM